ncbi:hypothetical protein F5Y04DRAFT_126567 [Hypomontagnella monticulosa]|nr:hypothetical protein F5Y04DRAFT_126567 [Hypomontagnella monticulosa]
MKFFRDICLIPIATYVAVVLAGRPGANGIGSSNAKGHSFGGSNRNGAGGTHNNAASGNRNSNHNGNGNAGSHGSGASHNQGQNNVQSSQGINSIVNAIRSADQQVKTVNVAIRNTKAGGTIDHLDSTLQSLTHTIRATSAAITAAGSLNSGDIQSLKLAIQPFHQSIGGLISQLVGRRETIAQLCACRAIQGALNNIRSSTRVMFDGIKNRVGQGGSPRGAGHGGGRGGHGFSGLSSFDTGIASFLNHGYNAFGFGNCIDIQAFPTEVSSYYTSETSTWPLSTWTSFATVVVTNTVYETVISTSWVSNTYTIYNSEYTSATWGTLSTQTYGGGYQASNVPSGSGYGGNSGASNTYGHQHVDN